VGDDGVLDYSEGAPLGYGHICPPYTEENSWIKYDPRVRIARQEDTVLHRKSLINPAAGAAQATDTLTAENDPTLPLGSEYELTSGLEEDEEHVLEYRGYPRTRIVLSFVGIRIKYRPTVPILKKVNDVDVREVSRNLEAVSKVGTIGGCDVFKVRMVSVYEATRPINNVDVHDDLTIEQTAIGTLEEL
jgi:hypothetical protein